MKNTLFALLALVMMTTPSFAETTIEAAPAAVGAVTAPVAETVKEATTPAAEKPKAEVAAPVAAENDLENTLYLDLKDGRVTIKLRPDLAPKHVARVKELVRKGFYNGLTFHRVIEGFMAQGGDPTGTGTSGSGQNIVAEFSPEPFVRGTVGMARSQSPNSADSQFFICFADAQFLNGQYTVWAQVTSGMDLVDKITRGEPPVSPDKIVKMVVAADDAKAAPVATETAPVKEEKKAEEKKVEKKAKTKKKAEKAVEKKVDAVKEAIEAPVVTPTVETPVVVPATEVPSAEGTDVPAVQ